MYTIHYLQKKNISFVYEYDYGYSLRKNYKLVMC